MTRDVAIKIRDGRGGEHSGNLSYAGQDESYRMTVALAEADQAWSAVGEDYFDALCTVRLQLDEAGLRLCVNGARVEAYPSGLSREMGGGQELYLLRRSSRLKRALRLPGRRTELSAYGRSHQQRRADVASL